MFKQLSNDHRSAQIEVKQIDVLCGKGKKSFHHGKCHSELFHIAQSIKVLTSFHYDNDVFIFNRTEGNVYFRDLVCDLVESFVTGKTAMQRSKVIQDAIDHIHSRGGRFLRRHQVDGTVRV